MINFSKLKIKAYGLDSGTPAAEKIAVISEKINDPYVREAFLAWCKDKMDAGNFTKFNLDMVLGEITDSINKYKGKLDKDKFSDAMRLFDSWGRVKLIIMSAKKGGMTIPWIELANFRTVADCVKVIVELGDECYAMLKSWDEFVLFGVLSCKDKIVGLTSIRYAVKNGNMRSLYLKTFYGTDKIDEKKTLKSIYQEDIKDMKNSDLQEEAERGTLGKDIVLTEIEERKRKGLWTSKQ